MAEKLTPQSEDFAAWYNEVIQRAELADYSPVRGCMVIRPYGYALWEKIQGTLDAMIKETGHQNAYFPLFIPQSFLAKEAEHVEGFAKECAIVTHSRLATVAGEQGGVAPDPASRLEEPLIVRPTSETIINHMYAKWIKSYRDLPVLLNQWANVVRWEMRTRLFLRTAEFLWQEGHTAHATAEEAEEEARKMHGVYQTLARDWLGIAGLAGAKSDRERFAGAVRTYTIEGLMRDGKVLQAGTSHNLGQNFARAFDIRYQGQDGEWHHVWQTSWGVSTRLVGAVVMAHGDDRGLILPPKIAPIPVVVVPIWKSDAERQRILEAAQGLRAELGPDLTVHVDDREGLKPGAKYYHWELRGVPVRIELGPRDLDRHQVILARRDTGEKQPVSREGAAAAARDLLNQMQTALLERNAAFVRERTVREADYAAFQARLAESNLLQVAPWCGSEACEERINAETKATIRVLNEDETPGAGDACLVCDEAARHIATFGKAY